MLDLVVDVKNNKKGCGGEDGSGRGGRRASSVLGPTLLKWLRQSGVEEVQIRNLPWDKLLDKSKRKGEKGDTSGKSDKSKRKGEKV